MLTVNPDNIETAAIQRNAVGSFVTVIDSNIPNAITALTVMSFIRRCFWLPHL
jgi:hypothetical protein